MSFDWNGYLAIAKDFKSDTDGQPNSNHVEAKRRAAISRAYYAVYHIAEDYAKLNLGYTPSKTGPNQHHSDVRSVYQRQFGNVEHQEVKQILSRLHKARINCDYKDKGFGRLQPLLSSIILDADKIKSILTS